MSCMQRCTYIAREVGLLWVYLVYSIILDSEHYLMGSENTDQWNACAYLDGSTTDFVVFFLRYSRASSSGSIRMSNAQARRPFATYAFEMAHLPAKRSMHSKPPWKLKACSITSISMHSRTGRKPGRLSPLGIARGNVHIGFIRFFEESLNFISWC